MHGRWRLTPGQSLARPHAEPGTQARVTLSDVSPAYGGSPDSDVSGPAAMSGCNGGSTPVPRPVGCDDERDGYLGSLSPRLLTPRFHDETGLAKPAGVVDSGSVRLCSSDPAIDTEFPRQRALTRWSRFPPG